LTHEGAARKLQGGEWLYMKASMEKLGAAMALTAAWSVLIAADRNLQQPAVQTNTVAPASADGTVPISQLRRKPTYISGTLPPDLPEATKLAAQRRYGKMTVSAIVTAQGLLTDIAMTKPSGNTSLDDAVIAALGKWKLTPPRDMAGNAVSTRALFPFTIGAFPNLLSGNSPVFPDQAKAIFHNGKVGVRGRIDPNGNLVEIKIYKSSKSDLLDSSVLSALAAFRFEKPSDLGGNPTSVDYHNVFTFTQAEGESRDYLSAMKTFKCRVFAGETDWWEKANPGAKPSEQEFNNVMSSMSLFAPEAFAWGRLGYDAAKNQHNIAWERARIQCRLKPDSTFLEHYRNG
jgi:TonB family protein